MLYHWHELDLETAAPIGAVKNDLLRRPVPATRYNAEIAVARANGVPYQLNTTGLKLAAANDWQTDAIATRLRRAGLGIIGEPKQRARPGDYTMMRQAAKLCRSTLSFISALAIDTIRLATQGRRQNVSDCSHTMVSNGADDHAAASDDAQRQRSNASIG